MIKAIIFDCFGVILGDAKQMRLNELMHTHPEKVEEIRALYRAADRGYLTAEEISQAASEAFGISVEAFRAEQDRVEVQNVQLLEYIVSLRSRFKVAMLSNISSRQRLDMRFNPGQLDTVFDAVIASGDEGFIKPQPEIFHIAAERLGVLPEECIFVDDIAEFCQGARDVGMQAIQFISTEQAIADVTTLIDRGDKKE